MKKWAAFWFLGLIWGSSFLFIRIGNEQTSPFQLVFIRTTFAAVGLNLTLALQKKHLPLRWKEFYPLLLLGIFNTVVPFALITWGEQSVDSGLASVLNATAALFTLIFAHLTFADERITRRKLLGLVTGFVGVVVLASRSWSESGAHTSSLVGLAAIVVASAFYGAGGTYGRRVVQNLRDPLMVSAGAMTTASALAGILMLLAPSFGGDALTPFNQIHGDALISLVLLGLINTYVAYLMFYWIVQELGAARASMVTYVTPPIGLTLGALVLNEQVDARLLMGAAMILAGIAIVNLRLRRGKAPAG